MDLEELSPKYASLSSVTSLSAVLVLALLLGFTPVEGQSQVVGSLRPIVAALGADVVLPCRVDPPRDVEGLTVEWSRPDLQPDPGDRLSRVEYVHLRRDHREVPDMKIASFLGRTTLFADGLRRGDISLTITNVTLADEGRFRCFVPKLRSRVQSSVVRLVVAINSENWTTETPLQHRSHQTPDLKGETDVKGGFSGRSRLTLVVVFFFIFLVILGFGVTTSLSRKWQKQEVTFCLGALLRRTSTETRSSRVDTSN